MASARWTSLQRSFIKIKFHDAPLSNLPSRKLSGARPLESLGKTGKATDMKKTVLALATALTVGVTALAAPSAAEAHWRGGGWRGGGWGPGIAGGLIGAAVIGGLASSAYAYGPGYGYYDDAYYGYAPAYYGGYTTSYYAPAYYGPRYRRVVRPAYAFYGGPRYHRWHHREYRHHW
jgi:hypothetical protein